MNEYCIILRIGATPTVAEWMRTFIRSHADYKHDSHVPHTVVYDMLKKYATAGDDEETSLCSLESGKENDAETMAEYSTWECFRRCFCR